MVGIVVLHCECILSQFVVCFWDLKEHLDLETIVHASKLAIVIVVVRTSLFS